MHSQIAQNIETVFNTFQQGKALSDQELGLDELISKLNEFEPRYRSVAFEGASMSVALQNSIETWKTYAEQTEKHATQVHIGLGWAIAEQQIDLASSLSQIDSAWQQKVLDGYGYWHGLFRRRLTIRTQQIPTEITSEHQTGFDQGVGRSIWYLSKGNVSKLENIISHFTDERKPNLWQGLGVASTYVGGCSDELIAELNSAAGENKTNFDKGVCSAEESMKAAQV